jgi:hypothetical protein
VVHETTTLSVDRRTHSAASIMAYDHDVLDLQDIDGELQHGKVIGILRRSEVGDIAMDEQFAGIKVHDLVRRHPAVGTADPEIFRSLLAFEPAEEIRILRDHPFGPGAVVGFQMIEHGGLR